MVSAAVAGLECRAADNANAQVEGWIELVCEKPATVTAQRIAYTALEVSPFAWRGR